MGTASTVPVTAGEPAPDGSDHKVAISKTFAECGVPDDYDVFIDELIKTCKYPPGSEMLDMALKEKDVSEVETDEGLSVKTFYAVSAEKARSVSRGLIKMECDLIALDWESMLDKKGRKIITKMYNGRKQDEPRVLEKTGYCRFLEPLQLVYYWENPDGTRDGGEDVAKALDTHLQRICNNILGRKVKLTADTEKDVVKTEVPMDDVATYDKFFDSYMQVVKDWPTRFDCIIEDEQDDDGVWCVQYSTKDGEDAGFILMTYDKEEGRLIIERNFNECIPFMSIMFGVKQTVKITKSPLTYETWWERNAERENCMMFFSGEKDGAESAVKFANRGLFG